MRKNHSKAIPPEVLTQVQAKIDEAITLLSEYVITLTPAERHELPKMGEKTLSFVEKSFEFSKQNPQFNPSYFNPEEFEIDMSDATGLRTVLNSAQQLVQNIDDTAMTAGSEAYQASLVFYNAVKYATVQDIAGAKAIYEDLRKRFPSTRKKKEEEI